MSQDDKRASEQAGKRGDSPAADGAWWFGVPIVSGVVAWLPYWIWNWSAGVSNWWRVPVATPGVFDMYVYLHWMGAAAEGLNYGGHLKWFGSLIIRPLWLFMSSWASLPELWIVSRWLVFALTLFVGAWCMRIWSGRMHGSTSTIGRWQLRALAVALWLSLLPLSLRPGMYSWYLPFVMLGLTLVPLAHRKLRGGHWVRALGLTLAALALTWLYPWFFMPVGLWLATIWLAARTRRSVWILPAVLFSASVVTFLAASPLARWFLDPAQAGLVGMYERNGMTFARVPFLANTVIALLAWPALLWSALRLRVAGEARGRGLVQAAWAWIVVLLLWFNTPFTGVSIYSDHLIAITVVLAWFSLSSVWGAVREPASEAPPMLHPKWLATLVPAIPIVVAGGASLVFIYILQQPLFRNIWRFDSYAVHLTHWSALAAAGWLLVWRARLRPAARGAHGAPLRSMTVVVPLLTVAFGLGLGATAPVILRDLPKVKETQTKAPVVAWIRDNVPPAEMMCADPEAALFYAAQTGRRVNPAEPTMSYPESSERVIRNLETLVGAYNVTSSGNAGVFRFATDHYRTIPCAEGSEYAHNASWFNLLRRMGYSVERANELIGCRQSVIDANWARVSAAIRRHTLDEAGFRELCWSVIVPDAQKRFWQLPADYRETRLENNTSIWRRTK